MVSYIEECEKKIDTLRNEKSVLREILDATIAKQEKYSHLEGAAKALKALEVANPKYAVHMIHRHGIDAYMYTCKSLESKQALMNEALHTDNPTVLIVVADFLRYTLNRQLFDQIAMNNPIVSNHYLSYLQTKDKDEFEVIRRRHQQQQMK